METEYQSTFDSEGNSQPKLHTKRYLHLTEDIHYSKGMLCQDCHTSNDMHGMDLWLGQIWVLWRLSVKIVTERPKSTLGVALYTRRVSMRAKEWRGKGDNQKLSRISKKGAIPKDIGDGFLLSARRKSNYQSHKNMGIKLLCTSHREKDIELKPLKMLKEEEKLSREGLIAMDKIEGHNS